MTFVSLSLYYLFNSKCALRRLLKFLFIKGTLNFRSVIISYFICHWNGQLNYLNFENLFRLPLSVNFIKHIFFLSYSNIITIKHFEANVLPPNFGYKFLHTLFRFPYDLLPSESFLSMNESYYCTDPQVSHVHQHIFLYY